MSISSNIAEVLSDIEAQLRQLGRWDKVAPSADSLASTEPFCVDTLSLPQWLQFIFLPTMYDLLEQGKPLPGRCGIAPMAQEYFRGTGQPCAGLVGALSLMDRLLSENDQGAA